MNYILNTKTKKVEIYWDNQNEYQALINFLSGFTITEEQNTYIVKNPNFAKQESITWAVNNLPNSYTINGNSLEGITGITTITDSTAETAKVSLNNEEFSIYANNSITALETKIQPKEDKLEYWLNENPAELHTGRHSQ